MRIKKSELRKRQPQLPINYPPPDVPPVDFEKEKTCVENLCKRLAESAQSSREAVLRELPAYLHEIGQSYSAEETLHSSQESRETTAQQLQLHLTKLCLGLFYAFFHVDLPLDQQQWAMSLSRMMHSLPTTQQQECFLSAQMQILTREWKAIDRWRLDKYLALVRKCVFEAFCHIMKGANEEEREARALRVTEIFQKVIDSNAVGLSMHVCDVFLDEAVRARCSQRCFCVLSRGIMLHALRHGDQIEQHVKSYFVNPIAAGALEARNETKPKVASSGESSERSDGFVKAAVSDMIAAFRRMSVSNSVAARVRRFCVEAQLALESYLDSISDPRLFSRVSTDDHEVGFERLVSAADERTLKVTGDDERRGRGGRKRQRQEAKIVVGARVERLTDN